MPAGAWAPHAAPRAAGSLSAAQWLALMAIGSALIIPEDASFFVGDTRLTITRILLIALLPVALFRYVANLSRPGGRALADLCVLGLAGYILLATMVVEGPGPSALGSVASVLEFSGAYFGARALFREGHELRLLVRVMVLLIALAGALAILDTLTGDFFIKNLVGSLTGYDKVWRPDIRAGLLRASSVYEHPIMLGMLCSAAAALALTLRGASRLLGFAGALIGLALALTSAGTITFVLTMGLLTYAALTPRFTARWRLLAAIGAAAFAVVFTFHPTPWGFLLGRFTLDAATGYFRLLIWTHAIDTVVAYPWFGIGITAEWARPNWMGPSVDAHWLRVSMVWGIPAAVLTAALLAAAGLIKVARGATPEQVRLARVLGVIIFGYVWAGFTVYYWGANAIMVAVVCALRVNATASVWRADAPDGGALRR